MSEPFFSVIVPAHNAQEYIRKGLHSIRKQTFTDYELIVVADSCDDDTALIALDYADKTAIRKYGLDGLSRNEGLNMAAGKYVLFMDDDDWWIHEYAFSMIADRLKEDPVDELRFGFIWKGRGYFDQKQQRNIAVWSKAWKREWIGDTRFPNTPYWSDVEFDRKMHLKDYTHSSLDQALYYYNYLRPGSISWRKEKGEIIF